MIRPVLPDELHYCRASWLGGIMRDKNARHAKRQELRNIVDMLLEGQPVIVWPVASVSDARADDVGGWCCYTPLATTAVVHYLYVRNAHRGESMRRRGIGTALLKAAGVNLAGIIPHTHATDLLPALLKSTGYRAERFAVDQVIV